MDLSESNDFDASAYTWSSKPDEEQLISLESTDEPLATTTADLDFTPVVPPPAATTTTTTQNWETSNPVVDSVVNQTKTELKKGQQQVEDIFTKTKRIVKENCKCSIYY